MLSLVKTDEQLIHLALSGSQRSWIKLVRRYESLVYNYCLRMCGESAEAMDLMQEVFLTVFRNLPSYRQQNQFKAWMMRIAANKTIDYYRQRERQPQHYADNYEDHETASLPDSIYDDPARQYHQAEIQQRVLQLMKHLTAEQRLLLEMKFFQHLTFEEISRQMNIPVNTLKTRLYTTLNTLKDQTEKQHVL